MDWLRVSFLLLIIAGLYFAALNVDAPLLYLLTSLVLSFLIIAWTASRNNLRKTSCRRKLQETSIFENQSIQIDYQIENNSNLSHYAIEIQDTLHALSPSVKTKENLTGWIASLPRKKKEQLSFTYRFPLRGIYSLGPILISSDYPFGLFRRDSNVHLIQQIRVYPEIIELHDLPIIMENHESILINPRIFIGQGDEFYGIREYRSGDPLRNIHWKGTARFQELMVREVQRNSESRIFICMDSNQLTQSGEGKESTFEYAVKIAASILFYAKFNEYPCQFQTQSCPVLDSFSNIMNYLSECEPDSETSIQNTILNLIATQKPYTTFFLIFSGIQQDLLPALRFAKEHQLLLVIIWIRNNTFDPSNNPNSLTDYSEFRNNLSTLSSYFYEIKRGELIATSLQSRKDLSHVY